jgi:MFS superfamily sulfate permease-like transporter
MVMTKVVSFVHEVDLIKNGCGMGKVVLGPDSSRAAVILGVVLPLDGGDPRRSIALASIMAVVLATVCILAGVARLDSL